MTLYLEDLAEGAVFRSGERTISAADVDAFAAVSGDFNPLHTDEAWVREHTDFDGRIAHGLLVLSASSGVPTPGLDELEVLAYLEVQRTMIGPVYPGEAIRVTSTVASVRPSRSRPGTGIVTLGVEVEKTDGDVVVQRGVDVLLVGGRPEAGR